jgi:hypothetical protein
MGPEIRNPKSDRLALNSGMPFFQHGRENATELTLIFNSTFHPPPQNTQNSTPKLSLIERNFPENFEQSNLSV